MVNIGQLHLEVRSQAEEDSLCLLQQFLVRVFIFDYICIPQYVLLYRQELLSYVDFALVKHSRRPFKILGRTRKVL